MLELSILLFAGLLAGAVMLVLLAVGAVLKLTFGVLKWVLMPIFALVGLVLLVTVGPVLLVVGGLCFVLCLPLLALCCLVWAGASAICLI